MAAVRVKDYEDSVESAIRELGLAQGKHKAHRRFCAATVLMALCIVATSFGVGPPGLLGLWIPLFIAGICVCIDVTQKLYFEEDVAVNVSALNLILQERRNALTQANLREFNQTGK